MKLLLRGWIGRSRGRKKLRKIGANIQLIVGIRINLESGEQTIMSAHAAPVKSVVYSKEHCKFPFLDMEAQL